MSEVVGKLCCPKCKNKLSRNKNELFCEKCMGRYYVNKEKMFDFSNSLSEAYKFYENNFGGSVLRDVEKNKEKYINSTLKDERSYNLISNINLNEGLVVDFGTGRGLIAGALKRLKGNLRIIGYDISPKACASALDLEFVDYAICCDDNVPLTDDSIDGAIMGDLIEHLLDPEQFLNEVRRILKPGGILSLSTPNVSFIRNRITMFKGEFPRTECDYSYPIWNAQHIRFFNFYTIKNLLYKCRFENVKVKGVRLLRGYKIPYSAKKMLCHILPSNALYEMMVVKAEK